MANQGFLSVSEIDFDGIKKNLKTYLQGRPEFTDYDFDGSNLSALLDILSYNTYMNAYYLNMVGSEMFLDTAQIKGSVVSHAKELNYVPRSRTSARALVQFTINTGGALPQTVVVPENYVLRTVVDGVNLQFTTEQDIIISTTTGTYISDPVYVYEGKVVEEFFTVGNDTRYILQSTNVDTNSIKVTVINSATDSTNSQFTYSEGLYGVTSTSKVFYVQGYNSDQYEIVFGDGVFGQPLTAGNIVKIKYRSTNGELGNKVTNLQTTALVDNYPVDITVLVAAADGSEREDTDSIKFYAPRHFNVQNRAVTKEDFINLIRQKFPQIKTVNAYGGEEADPPQYGKVIVSLIPYGSVPIVSQELKQSIVNFLKTKTVTTEAVIQDPDYLYVEVDSSVIYRASATTKTSQQIKTDVINQIKAYDANYLVNFGDDLRKSKLDAMIDTADASIVSNQTSVRAVYKIAPRKSVQEHVVFTFSNPIDITLQTPYVPGQPEAIKSTQFTYLKNNTFYNAFLSDDGVGNLRIYYSAPGFPVVVLEPNVGTIDYTTGNVTMDVNIWDYVNTIDISAKIATADINVKESKFLRIDYSKINVNVNPI